MNLAAAERRKYELVWSHSEYRRYSPGEAAIPYFRQLVRKRGTLIDLGCGAGRAGSKLHELGFKVTLLDFVDNSLDYEVMKKRLPFIRSNLWTQWQGEWDYGYCCDVMEHIPTEKVEVVVKRIFRNCRACFFSIHFGPDNFGKAIGHPLHLTIQPFTWWRDLLMEYGELVNARDLLGMGCFYLKGRS
jgi:2-polyprenyl-3-methyl-5-hydroxy-6-metoxy-1,4-benzoquinol methylase